MKVAVVFHRFGPYHCVRLGAAARRCNIGGIELGSETSEYGWGKVDQAQAFERVTLFAGRDSRSQSIAELEERMAVALSQHQPDVVAIPGWSEKGALAGLRWCLDKCVPTVLMSETTAADELRAWWKEFAKRQLVNLCSAALVGGERHKSYLQELGMPSKRVFLGYDAVDNKHFAQGVKKGEDGLPENYFLASARFIPKKNLDSLVRAYAEYRRTSEVEGRRSEPWSLVILGDGPLKADLQSLISNLGLERNVLLAGFQQYEELPRYYSGAGAFVHSSRVEQWGLVVNEAMASGLPVIVSDRCGCAPELVQEGVNGFTFDPDNERELTDRLLEMASLPDERRSDLGQASSRIVAEFGPERFGDGLIRAAETALEVGPRRPTLTQRLLLQAWRRR